MTHQAHQKGFRILSEGARAEVSWMIAGLRGELYTQVYQNNEAHTLTAYRLMAWEEMILGRRLGLVRTLWAALCRPSVLQSAVVERAEAMVKADKEAILKRAADMQAEARKKALAEAGGAAKAPPVSQDQVGAVNA
jgi:hypothetical protein